jgi:hypothetical protein
MSTPPRPSSKSRGTQARAAPTAILVLGMHRSGTSAIARLLNLRGADLGRDLLPPKPDNERGFWENSAVLALHETLLGRQDWHWHDLLEPGTDWLRDAPAREFVTGLPAVLAAQFAGSRLMLVKDPRLSLFAPLWIETLAALKVRPVFVITIRHPDEVAASLAKRDGFSFARSHSLWLQHLAEAERATCGHARVFVHYERLLADWRAELERIGRQLDIAWPEQPAGFEIAVEQFIAPTLRHHHDAAGTAAALPAMIRRVYERACAAASDAIPATASFEDVLGRYDDWMPLMAQLYRDLTGQLDHANQEYALEINTAREAFAIRDTEVAQARTNIDSLTGELEQAGAAHAARDQTESELRAALQDRDAQIEQARIAFTAKEAEVDAARRNIDALNADLDASRCNIDTLTTELGLARQNIHTLAAEIVQARDAFALKEQEIDAARRNIGTLASDLDRAREAHALKDEQLAAAGAALSASQHALASKEREIDAARSNIDNLVAEIERARQAHGARDAVDAALRQTRWFRLGRSLRLIGGDKP